jgi:lipid A disaccharide synthetase
MFANNIIGKRCFSSFNNRIAIMANSNSADSSAARFMKSLKTVSGEDDFYYFGYGGSRMFHEGLHKSQIDINQFNDKTFYTWRKTKQISPEHAANRWHGLNWVNLHFRRNANNVLAELEEKEFAKRMFRKRPSVVLSFDNEYFTFEFMEKLNKFYHNSSITRPQKHYFNRFIKDMRPWDEKYVDFMHYKVPKRTATHSEYFFPGQYVGQQGVFDAIKHLMSSDPEQKHLVSDNHLSVSNKWFGGDLEKSVQKVRAAFREKHKIDDDATVIFFAPGNETNEATFCFESVRKGVEEFLLKYSSPTSLSPIAKPLDKFHTVISLERGSESRKHVKKLIEERGWKGDLIIVSNHENEHFDAMAASDLGLVYDGQMVGSAAACHLPSMILLDMRMHHQWYHDLFNRWWNEMVTIADKDIYPEIIGGQAWFGKI